MKRIAFVLLTALAALAMALVGGGTAFAGRYDPNCCNSLHVQITGGAKFVANSVVTHWGTVTSVHPHDIFIGPGCVFNSCGPDIDVTLVTNSGQKAVFKFSQGFCMTMAGKAEAKRLSGSAKIHCYTLRQPYQGEKSEKRNEWLKCPRAGTIRCGGM